MDSWVEKLENDVNSFTVGQQQILDKLNELSLQLATQTNTQHDQKEENSMA